MLACTSFSNFYADLIRDGSKSYNQKIRTFLQNFKIFACKNQSIHKAEECPYYHSDSDKRRNPYNKHTFRYFPKISCDCQAEKCMKVHNEYQKIYHPLIYKTTHCNHFYQCSLGLQCPYLHSEDVALFSKGAFFRFDINLFKTEACPFREHHERDACLYYHNEGDRRRSNFNEYSHVLCSQHKCNNKRCKFAHNKIQQLYHPSRYKTKFCHTYQKNSQRCNYKEFCSFAHKHSQIVIDIIHLEERDYDFYVNKYKTIWCPFTQNHERGNCPYAHNFQDYRRNPNQFTYKPEKCLNWNFQDQIKSIEESGCEMGINCDKCHGWIQHKYHPLNYKRNNKNNPSLNFHRKDFESPRQIVEKKIYNSKDRREKSQKNLSNTETKGQMTSVGAPFFKQEKQISQSSRKTMAKSANISSDKSNDGGSCMQERMTQSEKKNNILIALPMFEDQDKVWRHNLNDFREETTQEVRYRSEEKQKQDDINYSKSIKDILEEIGIQSKLREKKINQVKIITLDDSQIKNFGFLDTKERVFLSKKLKEYNLKKQLKPIKYSNSLTRFFVKKQCQEILEKMMKKKVNQNILLNLNDKQIEDLSFLSEEEKKFLPKMLKEFLNEKEFREINTLIQTTTMK